MDVHTVTFPLSLADVFLRLFATVAFCGAVGLQRALAGKAAGLRTHILVGVGAAIFTIVSGYAFNTTSANAERIAAQVVSGIGFIGGGAILKERGSIKGLTTATTLWTTAALGMAAGAGLYLVGLIGTTVILSTLILLKVIERLFPQRSHVNWLVRVTVAPETGIQVMGAALERHARQVEAVAFVDSGAVRRYTFRAQLPRENDLVALRDALTEAGARSVACRAASEVDSETEGSAS